MDASRTIANAAVFLPEQNSLAAALASGGAGNSYEYGGFNIVVNAAPGQDVNEIADAVSRRINNAINRKKAVWA
jgi:hypothetical protein